MTPSVWSGILGSPFTIIRPAATGDSRTGEARSERSRMIYGFILAMIIFFLRLFADEKEFWKKWGEARPRPLPTASTFDCTAPNWSYHRR